MFTGVIAQKSAKIKTCEQKENGPVKYKSKFTAVVTTGSEAEKFAIEHLEVRFMKLVDRENFEKVYLQVANK